MVFVKRSSGSTRSFSLKRATDSIIGYVGCPFVRRSRIILFLSDVDTDIFGDREDKFAPVKL